MHGQILNTEILKDDDSFVQFLRLRLHRFMSFCYNFVFYFFFVNFIIGFLYGVHGMYMYTICICICILWIKCYLVWRWQGMA